MSTTYKIKSSCLDMQHSQTASSRTILTRLKVVHGRIFTISKKYSRTYSHFAQGHHVDMVTSPRLEVRQQPLDVRAGDAVDDVGIIVVVRLEGGLGTDNVELGGKRGARDT